MITKSILINLIVLISLTCFCSFSNAKVVKKTPYEQPIFSYFEARKYLIESNIKTLPEYLNLIYETPGENLRLPETPQEFYNEKWVDWEAFFAPDPDTENENKKNNSCKTFFN